LAILSLMIEESVPRFHWVARVLILLASILWLALEGNLTLTACLAALLTALLIYEGLYRLRRAESRRWSRSIALFPPLGFLTGITVVLITLALMVLKSGLHAHGPEFTRDEFELVWRQGILLAISGLLCGTALAILTFKKGEE